MSSYKPLSEREASDMMRPPLIEDGRYQFEIVEVHSTDKHNNPMVDKSGAPMTKLRLKIWDKQSRERTLFTNLFWGADNGLAYRTRHFSESIGVLDLYDNGTLLDNIIRVLGRTGHCDVYVQKGRDKNDGTGEKWPDKNDIKDFVKTDKAAPLQKAVGDEFIDSDLPF